MSKIIKYKFHLKSVSPLYFGSNESGEILKTTDEVPFVTGNSIGGAIRNFLTKYKDDIVIESLGGKRSDREEVADNKKMKFIESNIIISDGQVHGSKGDINKKEGTKVNRQTATADDGSKYEFEYLSKGAKVNFEFEAECDDIFTEKKFKDIICCITEGFSSGELTLGGHYNEGFGKFKIDKLKKIEFDLTKIEGLERYVFNRNNEIWEMVNLKDYIKNHFKYDDVVFKLEGGFPYGVYQNFDIKCNVKLSGIQKGKEGYYIPSSSIKGLLRSEIEKLYNSLGKCGDDICQRLFGGKDSKGKIRFEDVSLSDAESIEVMKSKDYVTKEDDDDNNPNPTYNKVDRLTGSSYNNALFSQRDIEGKATIKFRLSCYEENKAYIYPILIILRNIGLGMIPIGGRSSIGLGEFKADHIEIITNEDRLNIKFNHNNENQMIIDDNTKLNEFIEAFKKTLEEEGA